MATLDLRASSLAIVNEAADTTTIILAFVDSEGQTADLSDWTFTAPILRGNTAVGSFAVATDENVVTLTLAAGTLNPGGYRWALVATAASLPSTWLAGPLTLEPRGSTRSSATTAVTVATSSSAAVSVQVNATPDAEALAARIDEIEAQSPFMVWQ